MSSEMLTAPWCLYLGAVLRQPLTTACRGLSGSCGHLSSYCCHPGAGRIRLGAKNGILFTDGPVCTGAQGSWSSNFPRPRESANQTDHVTQVVAEREFTPRNLQASLLVLILSSCFLLETGGMKTMTNIRSEAKCALLEVAFIIPINVSYSRDREGKKLSPLSRLTPCWQEKGSCTQALKRENLKILVFKIILASDIQQHVLKKWNTTWILRVQHQQILKEKHAIISHV